MNKQTQHLKQYLQNTLKELDRLSEQICKTHDYSEQAELVLCLREMVIEQMEGASIENSCSPNHPIR